jgi:PadR family transcriptional regulator, regulatory protein AphA
MSINNAILGMLSYEPMTGYDLKKIMQESPFMYWSGNNNQIYKALVELLDEGYVTSEIYHQDSSPSKKVYTITDDGLAELKRWTQSVPEAPEIKKLFLVQLAWTEQSSSKAIENLLMRYEQVIKGKISIEQAKKQKEFFSPKRTPREAAIWDLIHENVLSSYTNELDWLNKARQTLNQFDNEKYEDDIRSICLAMKEEENVTYKVIEKSNQKYLLLESIGRPIQSEQDGIELISICAQNGTNLLLIEEERLSDDFIRLRTGIAGAVLQKFATYNIKAVAVLGENRTKGKFKEFLSESNNGSMFRAYTNFSDAENWLLGRS